VSVDGLPRELREAKYDGTPPTSDELRLLRLVSKGFTVAAAGRVMGKSAYTANDQMKLIRARLGAETAAHAVAVAIRRSMIP
jgi:DNA-binding CsgD family transcriptional regulator